MLDDRIGFPRLPKLLSSATHLVSLCLAETPHYVYISPDAMVAGLSALTSLLLEFHSSQPRSDRPGERGPPPPALKQLTFQGVSDYAEEFASRIDAPLLDHLHLTFFN